MITRREKLLIRPWEQRRYENHRRKVRSAVPAIDVAPPPDRIHVICKLKKQQKENERCDKIEKDNLKLLQRMRKLMSTSRVDNTWSTAQPSFLNRVELYSSKTRINYISKSSTATPEIERKSRKERCHACTPHKIRGPIIPEQRVPWNPPKSPVSRKRSQSLPPKIISADISKEKTKKQIKSIKSKSAHHRSRSSRPQSKILPHESTQSIVLSRGDLNLSVNFPSDTLVKLKNGQTEKIILRCDCQCKAMKGH